MAATEQGVFAVVALRGAKWCRLGFCEGYMTLPETVIPFRSFRRMTIRVDHGVIACRARWHPPTGMARTQTAMQLQPWEDWMSLDANTLLEAIDACQQASIELPTLGYKRRFR